MKSIWTLLALMTLAAFANAGCSGNATVRDPLAPAGAPPTAVDSLDASATLQSNLVTEFDALRAEFEALKRSGGWRERGYFDAREQEAIAGLLFRFVVNHSSFWNELDRRGGAELSESDGGDPLRTDLLALHAGMALADSSSFLVSSFIDDPVAIAKLNEPFYRYEIPADTYDRLGLSITATEREKQLRAAWQLHEKQLHAPGSGLAALAKQNAPFAKLLTELEGLHGAAVAQLEVVQNQDKGGPSALEQRLRHSEAEALGRESAGKLGDARYAIRSLVFKDVSRIKNPTVQLIRFSPAQKIQIHDLLRPGDIILTYTAGYISDVFIPGKFKHGITYVGDVRERHGAGLTPSSAPDLPSHTLREFHANLAREVTADGKPADLIEAVAEGVKFSNLDRILDTHINRLLVLRPIISEAERVDFLAGVFSFLGDPYDFRFDFGDASRQVCTEVIYRALNGKSGIQFVLVPRGGHPTLSADDVVDYHLTSESPRFEFVLFAEEDPDASDHRARVWVDTAGEARIAERMKAPSD